MNTDAVNSHVEEVARLRAYVAILEQRLSRYENISDCSSELLEPALRQAKQSVPKDSQNSLPHGLSSHPSQSFSSQVHPSQVRPSQSHWQSCPLQPHGSPSHLSQSYGLNAVESPSSEASSARAAMMRVLPQAVLNSAHFAIIATDLQGTIQFFNVGAEAMLGYQASEVVGKSSLAIFQAPGFAALAAKAQHGQPIVEECLYGCKDGSRRPVALSIAAIYAAPDERVGYMGVAQDISPQKQAEQQTRNITAALDQTAIVAITDIHGTITFANDTFCEISQYSREELIGQNHRMLNSGYHPREFFVSMWQAIASGQTWRAEIKNRAKDGSYYWVDTTIIPFRDEQGQLYQYLAIRRDITARKAAEAELQKLSLVASQTDNVAIVTDPQGYIEWVNDSFYRITGYTLEEVKGQKPGKILQGADTSQETIAEIREALAHQRPFFGEILNYHKSGCPYWLLLQINPVFDESGQLTYFIAIESEITTRKQMEAELKAEVEERKRAVEELRLLAERLEISNRELQDFAYVSSHDLQEPLRKIQAFGDRLKSTCHDSLNEKGQDYLERMLNAAGRAQVLINDLLTFSRVTTKAQPFETVDLAAVLAGVLADLEVGIEQTGATVACDPLPSVAADPLQMRQLLQNLIGNALKFCAPDRAPHVQVRSRLYSEPEQDWCEICVIDNGIGFEQKYAERIFQIFQRLHGRGDYGGTGIGLAICRKIAERHHGTLTAQSELGRGATFTFALPVYQISGAYDA